MELGLRLGSHYRSGSECDNKSNRRADHASHTRYRNRLGEELYEDVPVTCACRLADAYLSGPFGDRGKKNDPGREA